MAKEFTYRGKTFEELRKMGISELADLLPARARRSIKKGFSDEQKKLLKKLEKKSIVETHCRDMVVLPSMVGKIVKIHKGNDFVPIKIQEEMIGHFLGEFVLTRKRVEHSAPGIGATRSSASISVR